MVIKSINNVVGYKGLPDGFSSEFDENKTYIIGANFQGKTTIGSLFNWCLTGTSLLGKEKEQVANDIKKTTNVIVDITFVDNFGIEHRLVREKGREMHLTLDGKEIEQGNLAQFYKNKDMFLIVHNPYYFWTLEPKQQKDLIRNMLPTIDSKEAFNLLDGCDQEIIKNPIENLSAYTDKINKNITELEREYNKNLGIIETLKTIALGQEGSILEFDKEQELIELQKKYSDTSQGFDNFNLEMLKNSIASINKRLQEILKDDLFRINEEYKRENNKLQDIDKDEALCPYCRQSMKDSEAKENLKKFYRKELNNLQGKADGLRQRAEELVKKKKEKQVMYDKLNTSDMQQLQSEREEIKERIDILQKRKNEVTYHNQEVEIRRKNIKDAKEKLDIYEKNQIEIEQELKLIKAQKKVANKLKILVIEAQKEKIRKYLNKVDIEFSKVSKTTGEITECCNIQYEGRDYKKLSKSQQARACLEISNVFNNITGINAPIFFDDGETTTDIQDIPNTQLIISLVIKYNKLEVLYDYEEVLERKEKSIRKEIEEKSSYEVPLAA